MLSSLDIDFRNNLTSAENQIFLQGELLYGYGGRKLYQYSIFKPLEGYF